MNKLMTRVAEVDPDFAKSLRRNQILSYVFAVVAVLAVGGAAWAVGVNFDQSSDITQVQHSACQVDAAGKECQQTKREAARAANLVTTCIPFWKAGYPCPKPGSTSAQRQVRRQAQAGSESAERLDSEPAPRSGGTAGGVEPPKVGSTEPSVPGNGGSKGGKAPAKSPAVETEAPTLSTTAAPVESSTEQTTAQPGSSSTSEAPPGLIGNPGGAVGEVACSASDAVKELAGVRVCSK